MPLIFANNRPSYQMDLPFLLQISPQKLSLNFLQICPFKTWSCPVVIDNSFHNIPNELELDPSSKNNEPDATKPLQVYSRRRATAIEPAPTQESNEVR